MNGNGTGYGENPSNTYGYGNWIRSEMAQDQKPGYEQRPNQSNYNFEKVRESTRGRSYGNRGRRAAGGRGYYF